MRLIQFREPGPPAVMQCLDVPIPEPASGEVLIRAHAIGVGMPDCLIRAGTYSAMPPLPATPGTELAGVIEKVGPSVTTRREGQRVYTTARERPHRGGHYAEYVATPAEATFLLPDMVDFEAAAALGADHVINRKEAKVSERVNEIMRGRGVEAIIDPVAGPAFPENIEMLAPCGTLLIYGALGGKAQLDLLPTLRLRRNSPAVRQFTIHTWDHLIEERRAGMRALIDMLAAGKLHPRIHARLPLSEATRAHEMLESGAVVGKLLLLP
jgi:NADPH:quinone reductase